MLNQTLIYAGSAFIFIWGVSHLFPTRSVVAGFGEISVDNRRIITMEWIIEGVALIYIGSVNAIVTAIDHTNIISQVVYLGSVVVLIVLAVVSLLTGFKINFLPFRLCPVIFTASAILISLGGLL